MSLQIVKDGVELKHLDITPSGTEEQSISQEEAEVYKQVYSLANKKGYKKLNQDWIDLLFGAYTKWALENGKYCPNYQDPDDVCDVGVYDELFDFLIEILQYDEHGEELDVETTWGNLIDWVSEELDGDIITIRSEKKYKSVSWDDIHDLIDFLQQNECEATQKTWTHTILEEGYDSKHPEQDYFPTQYEVPMFRFHLVRESGLSYAETECPQT